MNFTNIMLDLLKQKIDEMGGADTLKKAIVWEWWENSQIKDERDFDSAIDECYRCHQKAKELKDKMSGGIFNEDTTDYIS